MKIRAAEWMHDASDGVSQVAYREAITKPCEIEHTHKKQSGGSGQFAKVVVKFEPLGEEDGESGFVFSQERIPSPCAMIKWYSSL